MLGKTSLASTANKAIKIASRLKYRVHARTSEDIDTKTAFEQLAKAQKIDNRPDTKHVCLRIISWGQTRALLGVTIYSSHKHIHKLICQKVTIKILVRQCPCGSLRPLQPPSVIHFLIQYCRNMIHRLSPHGETTLIPVNQIMHPPTMIYEDRSPRCKGVKKFIG